MSGDQWESLKQYNLQQRRAQKEEQKRRAMFRTEEEEGTLSQLSLLEQARRDREQRHVYVREQSLLHIEEEKQTTQDMYQETLSTFAEQLRTMNQQAYKAQQEASQRLCETQQSVKGSPIEEAFYAEWCLMYPQVELKRQYPIGKYRVDFAHLATHLVIELDGHKTHSSRKDRTRDYQRQRVIEDEGWTFLRFTGSEIYADTTSCVFITYNRIQQGRHGQGMA